MHFSPFWDFYPALLFLLVAFRYWDFYPIILIIGSYLFV